MTVTQTPIHSGFTAASTATDVIDGIDLAGKTAIVTGGHSGIGLETVRALRAAGARVIVPARDTVKAAAALESIAGVEIMKMDLMAAASIDAFCDSFLASGEALHILINNAGIMASPLARDARDYESQFATNHLGHFQLTARLWPALVKALGARVVTVSSWGHRQSPVMFDDPHFERRQYDRWAAYGQSKTANVLFTVAADARGKADGIRAFALHPGTIVQTNLGQYLTRDELFAAGAIDEDGGAVLDPARNKKTIAQGAATQVWCAVSPQLDGMGGLYCENSDVAPLVPEADRVEGANAANRKVGSPALGVMPYAVDPIAAERLWKLSEELTGTRLDQGPG